MIATNSGGSGCEGEDEEEVGKEMHIGRGRQESRRKWKSDVGKGGRKALSYGISVQTHELKVLGTGSLK